MSRILHITQCLTKGGAGRSLVATAKYSGRLGAYQHKAISLVPVRHDVADIIHDADLELVDAPSRAQFLDEIQSADIVQVHFWNNPNIYELLRSELPAMRLLVWVMVAGDRPPQVVTSELADYSDRLIGCSPYTYESIQQVCALPEKIGMVLGGTDFARCEGAVAQPHDTFNVGYIGSVDFVKMHPNYFQMSAAIDIPTVKFITIGRGRACSILHQQANALGLQERFEFVDYVENHRSVIEILDVFGYPLCEETYAASELIVQDVMYCGVPPVVFPYGGLKRLVIHNETGLVVESEHEYKQAIEYLYHHPEERQRLGNNARQYAQQHFGAENAIQQLHPIYEKLLEQPKRQRQWSTQPRSGAECFVESLGETAPHFRLSLTSQDTEALLASDRVIAKSSPLMQSKGLSSGGIMSYHTYYPNDAYLRLWAGLVWKQRGEFNRAASEFSAAIQFGFKHWRALYYLADTAEQIGDLALARQAAIQLAKNQPDLLSVRKMCNRLLSISTKLKLLMSGFCSPFQRVKIVLRPMYAIKVFLKSLFNYVGLDVTYKRKVQSYTPQAQESPHVYNRASMSGVLKQLSENGVSPQTVIDVGAAVGTKPLYEIFPDARHILIEPLEEFLPHLQSLVLQIENAEYIIAVAAETSGEKTLNVHPDLVGSSLYLEEEDSDVNGEPRNISAITLDQVCADTDAQEPYLIKVDTQGSELDVLKGATRILADTDVVIMEVSLFEFFKGGYQFYDCIQFMKDRGFVVYDIFGLQYRPLDGAMSQVDIAFVQEHGWLRKHHCYATREQRKAQNSKIMNSLQSKV